MTDIEETMDCGMCGCDPVAHEHVEIGVTEVDMCEECYRTFLDATLGGKVDGRS